MTAPVSAIWLPVKISLWIVLWQACVQPALALQCAYKKEQDISQGYAEEVATHAVLTEVGSSKER